MTAGRPRRARVIARIPQDRVDPLLCDGVSCPRIGDVVELEQGFTSPQGEPMGIAVCANEDGTIRWVADVFDAELELIS